MQNLWNKHHHDQATDDSYEASYGGHLSLWFPNNQSPLSLPNDVEMRTEYDFQVKLSESRYQEQDLSSTRSSRHSNLEAATSRKSKFHAQNISSEPGFHEACNKKGGDCVTPSMAYGNADFDHQVPMEHYNPSLDCISYPFVGSYFGRITSDYEPNLVVYPQMMGLAPTGTVLPLDSAEGIIPIYVNAKQYHAILRRRQARAKLEAQNKVTKSRKPYLHESRHRHALKRARGLGGRFLNTKNMQEPKPSTQTVPRNIVLSMNASNSGSNNSWGASTPSGSDVSCIFNNDDIIFKHPNLGVPINSLSGPHDRMALWGIRTTS